MGSSHVRLGYRPSTGDSDPESWKTSTRATGRDGMGSMSSRLHPCTTSWAESPSLGKSEDKQYHCTTSAKITLIKSLFLMHHALRVAKIAPSGALFEDFTKHTPTLPHPSPCIPSCRLASSAYYPIGILLNLDQAPPSLCDLYPLQALLSYSTAKQQVRHRLSLYQRLRSVMVLRSPHCLQPTKGRSAVRRHKEPDKKEW